MRPFRYLPQYLRVLLIINAVIFGASYIFGILGLQLNFPGVGSGSVKEYVSYFGAFWPFAPEQAWRFVTYMFVHVDFFHFLFNMLMLWMFGSEVADFMGGKKFCSMYIFCGIFAAFFSMIMFWLGLTNNPIIGASGALMGIFVAYYKLFPNRMLLMFFFIPMRIKYAMWFMVAIDVFMAPSNDGVAHLAHLGGVVGGFIFMRYMQNGIDGFIKKFSGIKKSFKQPKFKMENGGNQKALEGEVFYMDENKRLDEILKKVNREGIGSLTESEKQFLLKAGDKIRNKRGF